MIDEIFCIFLFVKNGVNFSLYFFVFCCVIGVGRRNIGNIIVVWYFIRVVV